MLCDIGGNSYNDDGDNDNFVLIISRQRDHCKYINEKKPSKSNQNEITRQPVTIIKTKPSPYVYAYACVFVIAFCRLLMTDRLDKPFRVCTKGNGQIQRKC